MIRRILFDLLFLAVAGWGGSILLAIGIDALGSGVIPSIVLGLLLLFAGSFIGVYTISKGGNQNRAGSEPKAWLFIVAFAISLSCALLLSGLFSVLKYQSGQNPNIPIIISLIMLPVAAIVSAAVMLLRPASQAESPLTDEPLTQKKKPTISIDRVVSNDPKAVCPLCRLHPHHENHVMIHCPACGAKFCSSHLDELDFRCYKCRAVIPYEKEIKLLILKRR